MIDGTTIKITKTTRDALEAIGAKGETYDTILNKLIDNRSNNLQEARINAEGRFPGSKTLADKIIRYKVKQ